MYEETKKAIKKAFEIGKLIFSLKQEKYNLLLKETSKIKCPSRGELNSYIEEGICFDDALIMELKNRYIKAARKVGLSDRYGIAMLEYAAMMEEVM